MKFVVCSMQLPVSFNISSTSPNRLYVVVPLIVPRGIGCVVVLTICFLLSKRLVKTLRVRIVIDMVNMRECHAEIRTNCEEVEVEATKKERRRRRNAQVKVASR